MEEQKLPEGYIPKEQRKKILLLSDDMRMPSGIGVMSREIIMGTCHRYSWIQVASAIQHPEQGKIYDISEAAAKETGVPDPEIRLIPYSGYGDANLVRQIMMMERPNAIMIFTDPRYWIWLFQIEHEIREHIPIIFYSIWDDLPFPMYNRNYYRSVDALFGISKQTHNIHKNVLGEGNYTVLSNN